MKRYVKRVARAASIFFNVLIGGYDDQTFAARNWVWKKQEKKNLVWLIDLIFGKDYCVSAWVDWQLSKLRDKDYAIL